VHPTHEKSWLRLRAIFFSQIVPSQENDRTQAACVRVSPGVAPKGGGCQSRCAVQGSKIGVNQPEAVLLNRAVREQPTRARVVLGLGASCRRVDLVDARHFHLPLVFLRLRVIDVLYPNVGHI
jgi:hypothetical protein